MELNTEQQRVIDEIAKQNKFKDFKITVEKGSNKGDNFVGVISRVIIQEDSRKLVVILKCAQQSEVARKMQPTRKFFLREIYLYEKLFPAFAAFEDDNNISDRFVAHPKLFGKCDQENGEFLVLEDMCERGFQLWNKKVTMSTNHINSILKQYAKFHSISIAMKNKKPQLFDELTKNLDDPMDTGENKPEMWSPFIRSVLKSAYTAVGNNSIAIEKLKAYENWITDMPLKNSDTLLTDAYVSVVIHGDCWCNNFLHKYESKNTNKPTEVCIIDWQLSKLASPTVDLAYFLFANGSEEVLKNYLIYLEYYHFTLCQHLRNFSCDGEEILSFEKLLEEFRKNCRLIFWFCIMIMRIQMCDSEEAPNFAEDMASGKNVGDIVNFSINNLDEFHRRVSLLVDFMIKNEII